jgi:hypothetical protein
LDVFNEYGEFHMIVSPRDTASGLPPASNDVDAAHDAGPLCRHRTVSLRRVPNDDAEHAAGQDDLPVVMLAFGSGHRGHEEGKERTDGATQPRPVSAPAVAPHAGVVSGPERKAARLNAITNASTNATPKIRSAPPFARSASVKPFAVIHAR